MADARLELLADSSQIRAAKDELFGLTGAAGKAEAATGKLGRATKGAGRNTADLSRKAGQAGIQVEQLVTSISAGANPTQAFAFQAADLGIVLGAPLIGSIVAVTAALGGSMLPALFDSADAADRLEESIDVLSRTASLGSDGILEYTEEIERLAEASQLAASGRVEAAIAAANEAALNAARATTAAIEDELDLDGFFADLEGAVSSALAFGDAQGPSLRLGAGFGENIAIAEELASQLGITGENAREAGAEIVELIAATQQFKTPESFRALEERLTELRDTAGIVATGTLNSLISTIAEFLDEGATAGEIARRLGEDLQDGIVEPADEAERSSRSLTDSLQGQIIALESGAQAAEVYATVQGLVGTEQEGQIPTLIELINRKYELKTAQEESAQAAREEAAAQKQLESDYQQFLRSLEQGEQQRQRRLEGAAEGQIGLTRLQALTQTFLAEQDLLEEAQAEGIESKISYEERLTELARQYAEQRAQITQEEAQTTTKFLSDGTSASLSAFANTLGNLAQLAQNAGEDSFQTYKNLASAQAGIAATLSILAVLGDTTITSTTARVALASSIGALAGAQVAQIQNQEYSGRATGGSVYSGNSYMVGERGPELFTPNSSGGGRITPFSQLMNEAGGGQNQSNVYVNVQNNASNSKADVQERTDSEGNRIIDVVVANIAQRGSIHREFTRTTTASNRI